MTMSAFCGLVNDLYSAAKQQPRPADALTQAVTAMSDYLYASRPIDATCRFCGKPIQRTADSGWWFHLDNGFGTGYARGCRAASNPRNNALDSTWMACPQKAERRERIAANASLAAPYGIPVESTLGTDDTSAATDGVLISDVHISRVTGKPDGVLLAGKERAKMRPRGKAK